jgi:hypothetical protein
MSQFAEIALAGLRIHGNFAIVNYCYSWLYKDTDGNWHRIALVFEDTERSLYVDDALVGRDMQAGGPASCEGELNIGCDKDMTAGSYFTGLIDDVRIYNRAVRP